MRRAMSEEKKMIVGRTLKANVAPMLTSPPPPPSTGVAASTSDPKRKREPAFV